MNMPSEDIKDMLTGESYLELIFANDLFIGKEPTTPDNCVTIFDTPGIAPMITLDEVTGFEYPSIQIRIRNNSYVVGYNLAKDIQDILHGINQTEINNTLYSVIYATGEPMLLDWDLNDRARFVINFEIQRRTIT